MKNAKPRKGLLGATHGGHDPDKVLIGGFVKPEVKARIQITADAYDTDAISIMVKGADDLATAIGIMKDGKVTKEYEDEVNMLASVIRQKKAKRQERSTDK